MEKILNKRTLASGRTLSLEEVSIDFGNGHTSIYERTVFNKDALGVMVVPVLQTGELVLLEQYQVGMEGRTLVLPRGGVPDEYISKLEEYANVELQEELGYKAGQMKKIGVLHPMPGYLTTESVVFLGTELVESSLVGDEHEELKRCKLSFKEAIQRISSGEIVDARTVAGIFMARESLKT